MLTPKQLLEKAKSHDLVAISITDHDTIKAYSSDIFILANSLGIELAPGIEFSTRDDDCNKYHILGLLIDLNNTELNKLVDYLLNQERVKEARMACSLLEDLGWFIDEEKLLSENSTITKAHISRAVLDNKKFYYATYCVSPAGIEPATVSLKGSRSTAELRARLWQVGLLSFIYTFNNEFLTRYFNMCLSLKSTNIRQLAISI